ncbi:MAG: hypothetical protein AAFP16_16530 [Pseudomonadota bacterium]
MEYADKAMELNSNYAQEQALFAEMQAAAQKCKRRQRRRRMLMWVLRRI